jgi:hypothetical protein
MVLNLPLTVRKTPKSRYIKPDSIKLLERMADSEALRLHPTCPALSPRKYRDETANGLTSCIVKYITLNGGFASRITNIGVYDRRTGKYRKSTSRKGLADVMSTFRGLSLHIEVKVGKDRQSDAQKEIEKEVNHSGGYYYIAKDFTRFKEWFDSL